MAKISLSSKFAHLIGLGAAAPAAATPAASPAAPAAAHASSEEEDPERKKKDGESDDEHAARLAKMDEDENCETDEDKEKAAAALATATAAARLEGATAERARWNGVLAHAEAGGRVVLACNLLADTDMSETAIVSALAACPRESARATLASRQAAEPVIPTPAPGSSEPAVDPKSDAAWAASAMKAADAARPQKRNAA